MSQDRHVNKCPGMNRNNGDLTRTTRTPAFWGYPRRLMITHTIESYWIPSQKKTKSNLQIYKFAKISNFLILKRALHESHLLKLLDKICKYEIDPMSIVEDTEWTRFCPQTDRRTRWYQYTPFQLRWSGGYNNLPSDDQSTQMMICILGEVANHHTWQVWVACHITDISYWHHDMGILTALLALCEGNPPVTGDFPSQRANNAELWCCFCC